MYVDSTQGTFGLSAVFQSPDVLGNTGFTCVMRFWYHLYGGEAGTLIAVLYENFTPVGSFSVSGNQGNQWNQGTLNIGPRAVGQYAIRFEATPGNGFGNPGSTADIALDDITFDGCSSDIDVNCDFGPNGASTMCAWQQVSDDEFDWTLRRGDTPTYYTGPKFDHTTPEGTGFYLYTEVSGKARGARARITSGQIRSTGNDVYCFDFWYHMYGPAIGELNVYIKTVDNEVKLFHKRGTQEFAWLNGFRSISMSTAFEIIIEGVAGPSFDGDIAVDDLSYYASPCPPTPECEFESDFCGWTNVDDDSQFFDWQRGMNGNPSAGTGPATDHTTESATGYFAYARVAQQPVNSEARLASPSYSVSGVHCLTFFYFMYGYNVGTLYVYKQDTGDQFVPPLWSKTGDQGIYWRQAEVEINPTFGSDFQIYFEAIAGSSNSGSMAIDDVVLTAGLCPVEDFCDFEQGLCTWQNDFDHDDFDWVRDGAGTGTGGTGPDVDHTLNSKRGYYMYVEASGRTIGDKAWFVSDRLPPTGGRCLNMWYHMFGVAVGDLNIYMDSVNSISPTLLRSMSGNQGNVWRNAKIDLQFGSEFQILIEGLIGFNSSSDIAIDDLLIEHNPCSSTPAPPIITTLPPTYPPDSHDCNFESNNFCQWRQDNRDNMNFILERGPTSSISTGPSYDHTLGTSSGTYAYLETSSGSPNYFARLISSNLISQGRYCMEFYYHMYGAHINELNVYLVDQSEVKIWTKQGNQGDVWLQGLIQFINNGTHKIIIEAVKGVSYQGDIAIDDIRFFYGTCPPPTFCDFEFGDCGYSQHPLNDFNWRRLRGQDSTTGLVTDHTYNTQKGHYMYASLTGQPNDVTGAIQSGFYPPTDGSCFQFFFAPVGDLGAGRLVVKQGSPSGIEDVIWTVPVGRLHQWHVGEVTMYSRIPGEGISIIFEANRENGTSPGGVAVDDISVSPGNCYPVGACSFEDANFCAWQNAQEGDDFDWFVKPGYTPSSGTGPSKDHTLGSPEGHYAFIESSSPQFSGDTAHLLSPMFEGDKTRCLEFYLHMYGSEIGTLNIYRRKADLNMERLFTLSQNKGDVWRKGSVTFDTSERVYDILIEAIIGSGFLSDIALDDFSISDGECPDEGSNCEFFCETGSKCVTYEKVCDFVTDCPNSHDEDSCGYACTFEEDICGWKIGRGTAFAWRRGRQQTPDDNSGPYIDHTTLSPIGYYVYLSSDEGTQGWGSFTSPTMHNSAASCELHFWCYFSGEDIGYLDVLIVTDYSTRKALTVDRSITSALWQQKLVVLGRITGAFKVEFRGARSFAVQGGIAFDDIRFSGCNLPLNTSGPCQDDEYKCDRGACIPDYQLCDFSDDCGDYSDELNSTCVQYDRCNFESGMCSFVNDDKDDADWQRLSGADANGMPAIDHTFFGAGGHFMYVGSAPNDANRATLVGPVYQPSPGGSCKMRVWCYSYGFIPGYLSFGYRIEEGGKDFYMQDLVGPFGDNWLRYEFAFFTSADFKPLIVARHPFGARDGVFAVDDITFTEECLLSDNELPIAPTVIPTTPVGPCGVGKWQCADESCIDKSLYCDFKEDCDDGSDEAACGPCEFEEDLCGYNDVSVGNHKWVLSRSSTFAKKRKRDAGGSFVMVDKTTGLFDEPAVLESTVLPDSAPKCSIEFWYQFESPSNQAILLLSSVDIANPSLSTELWQPPSDTKGSWQKATVGVGRQSSEFKIRFSAYLYNDADLAAIDGITWDDCQVEHADPCDILCGNNLCVSFDTQCDFTDDCGDMTDESDCGNFKERCDFENGLCNWMQSTADDLDWVWVTGGQGSTYGAPGGDHTTLLPQGHYLYLRSFADEELKKARLGSPVFLAAEDCKMRFWYFMYGTDVGSLTVLTINSVNDNPFQVWQKTGNQEDGWVKAEISFQESSKYQVLIEGVTGRSTDDDHISIDDFSFTPACSLDPENKLPDDVAPTDSPDCDDNNQRACKSDGLCLPKDVFCDFKFDCDDGSDENDCPTVCNFEEDLCKWEQDKNDDVDWIMFDGSASIQAIPPYDHTINRPTGKYVYIDGSASRQNQRARLLSPTYGQSGLTCTMSFWYYRYGATFGTLSAYIRNSEGTEILLSTVSSTLDDYNTWIRQDVKLPICEKDFKVIMSAVNQQPSAQSGGYAVDDIRLEDCTYELSCNAVSGLLQCQSGHCYPEEAQCDFNRDCCLSDTDESNCGQYERCDFENDMCSWSQMTDDEGDWVKQRASDDGNLPLDHTRGSSAGHVVIFGSSGSLPRDRAGLNSYALKSVTESQNCALRFFMYLGHLTSEVHVYTRTQIGGPKTEIWSTLSGDFGVNIWIKGQVMLSSDVPFEVILEAVQGTGTEGIVAIDDTSLTPGCVRFTSGLPTGPSTPSVTSSTKPMTTEIGKTPATPADNKMVIIIICSILGCLLLAIICVLTFFYCRKTRKASFSEPNGNLTGLDNPMYGPSDTPMTDFKMVSPETTPYMAPEEA